MTQKVAPLVEAGSEILHYSATRNWRFAREVYARSKVLAAPHDNGFIPVSRRFVSDSLSGSPYFINLPERALYKDLLSGDARIGKYEKSLSVQDLNFAKLWEVFCEGKFDQARKMKKDNPTLYVKVHHDGPSCGINEVNLTPGSQFDIKFEILDDDALQPFASHPYLLEAVAMFNSVIRSIRSS